MRLPIPSTYFEEAYIEIQVFISETIILNNSNHSLTPMLGCLLLAGEDGGVGVAELGTAFLTLPGVDPRLLPQGWVQNHYR
jgi:BRCA2, helical